MSELFIRKHRADWERFNRILSQLETLGKDLLHEDDIRSFGSLYRKISSDLAYAKAQSLDTELIEYLNNLAGRGYNHLYSAPKRTKGWIDFFRFQLPAALRGEQNHFWAALLLIILGTLGGYLITRYLPYVAEGLFPKVMGEELLERYRNDRWFNNPLVQRPLIASLILTNNLRVALIAFGTGIAGAVFTFLILLFNSMLIGHLAAYFARHGHAYPFWSAILPHGIIELTALGMAAAGGFVLGKTMLFPGDLRRADALRLKARDASCLFISSLILLGIAGLIEGLFSTIPTEAISNEGRLVFAAGTLIFLVVLGRRMGLDPRSLFSSSRDRDFDTK